MTLPDPATRPVAPVLEDVTPEQKRSGRHLKMIHDHQRQNMRILRELIAAARAGGLPEGGAEAALQAGWIISGASARSAANIARSSIFITRSRTRPSFQL